MLADPIVIGCFFPPAVVVVVEVFDARPPRNPPTPPTTRPPAPAPAAPCKSCLRVTRPDEPDPCWLDCSAIGPPPSSCRRSPRLAGGPRAPDATFGRTRPENATPRQALEPRAAGLNVSANTRIAP